jgi:hypothetical protein
MESKVSSQLLLPVVAVTAVEAELRFLDDEAQ